MGSEVREVVQRSPLLYGLDRHGWALDGLRHVIPWMGRLTRASISKLLRRFQLVYKRGRAHVHSPDLEYNQKMAAIAAAREEARQAPTEVVFLYEDEFTAYLRPLVGSSYRPRSERGQKATGASADKVRLAGCVDAMTGRVVWRRRSRYNVKEMYRFFYYVQKQYPQAKVIYLALDNWPVHFHPYVQEHLASMKPTSRLRFLPLPTYAPWTNPTEKYWLKLSREWLRFHPYAGDKKEFVRELDGWLRRHCDPSPDLLHEVGLLPNSFVNVHQRVSRTSLAQIFGPALLPFRGGCVVDLNAGEASLGYLIPAGPPHLYVNEYGKIRAIITDGTFTADLSVTDLRLCDTDHRTPKFSLVERIGAEMRSGCSVVLSVGLARPWRHPDDTVERHWLHVNNIHMEDDALWLPH